jgi:hypothetical protein
MCMCVCVCMSVCVYVHMYMYMCVYECVCRFTVSSINCSKCNLGPERFKDNSVYEISV